MVNLCPDPTTRLADRLAVLVGIPLDNRQPYNAFLRRHLPTSLRRPAKNESMPALVGFCPAFIQPRRFLFPIAAPGRHIAALKYSPT